MSEVHLSPFSMKTNLRKVVVTVGRLCKNWGGMYGGLLYDGYRYHRYVRRILSYVDV
jgi:hypothetical protein